MEFITYYFNKKIFKIKIVKKNNKNMYLKVRDNNVVCFAPLNLSDQEIIKFVNKHSRKFFEYIENINKNKLYCLSKNFIYLSGKKYQINRVINFSNTKVEYNSDSLYIYAKNINDYNIEKILRNELKEITFKHIQNRQSYFEKLMAIDKHEFKVVYKTSNWGMNIVKEKRISYSSRLGHFHNSVIDYVIIHELTHNKEPNHSKQFWDIVKQYIPNYKKIKNILKKDTLIN